MLSSLFCKNSGKGEFPHPEISPGITAKFQLCSVLAAESHTIIPLPIPLASGLERKRVDPGNLCKVFSTKLVDVPAWERVPVRQMCT